MEMEVPVEKNLGAKMFGFGRSESGDYSESSMPEAVTARTSHVRPGDELGDNELPPPKLPQMLKMAVIGESTVGKTAICEAFCRLNFTASTKYFMTCGVQIYGKTIKMSSLTKNKSGSEDDSGPGHRSLRPQSSGVNDERVNMILMDSSGKDVYLEYLPSYWEKLDGVVLVVDLSAPHPLDRSLKYLELVKGSMSGQPTEGRKMGVLIGNKMDLETQRGLSSEDLQGFASEHNLEYFECSARSNIGLEEPFHYLASQWFERVQQSRESLTGTLMFRGRGGAEPKEARVPRGSAYLRRNLQ